MRVVRKVRELSDENLALQRERDAAKKESDFSNARILELIKENEELKERWRKTHEPSELRVQLARTVEELNELKRQVNDLCVSNERYARNLAQKL